MRKIDRPRLKLAVVLATAASVAALPACDPSTLTPAQRQAVTGTTDTGSVTVTVDPAETTLEDNGPHEISFAVTAAGGFVGSFTLSLSGLTPDFELVKDVSHSTFIVSGDTQYPGSFSLRALGARAEPV